MNKYLVTPTFVSSLSVGDKVLDIDYLESEVTNVKITSYGWEDTNVTLKSSDGRLFDSMGIKYYMRLERDN